MDNIETRCVVCNLVCDSSGLCDDHKYDDQPASYTQGDYSCDLYYGIEGNAH